jgi:hypothetical protein
MTYPWYETLPAAHELLEQGDLIINCPIIIPPQSIVPNGEYLADVQTFDVVVVSQSCDLAHGGKIENVLVCPYYSFRDYAHAVADSRKETLTAKGALSHFDDLRQGHQPSFHLLNQPAAPFEPSDYLVVDFRNVYAVHISFLKEYIKILPERIRLLPPYREHLSQAFARFFMRVGLPHDIPKMNKEQGSNYLAPPAA